MNSSNYSTNVLSALSQAKVEYVLIGGLAMAAHGARFSSCVTDIFYNSEQANTERLAAFLLTIHARVLGRPAKDNFVLSSSTLRAVRFLNLATDLGDVDVMREVPGVESFEGLWERAVALDLGGFVVRVASLADLISMKRAANRPKDQAHLLELLALQKLTENEAGPPL